MIVNENSFYFYSHETIAMIKFPDFMELSDTMDEGEFYFDIYTRIEACNQ